MTKGFWAGLLAGLAAVAAAVLYALVGKKPTPGVTSSQQTLEDVQTIQEDAAAAVADIEAKTDAEVVEQYTTPAEKEKVNDIVDSQVDKAMHAAEKYKRKKP